MQAFNIQCTTCRRSLRVVNPEAVGQILSCPKCGSMVLVEAPPGWNPDASPSAPVLPPASGIVSANPSNFIADSAAGNSSSAFGSASSVIGGLANAPSSPLPAPVAPIDSLKAAIKSKVATPSAAVPSAPASPSIPLQSTPSVTPVTPVEKAPPWKNPPEIVAKAGSTPTASASVAAAASAPKPKPINRIPESVAESPPAPTASSHVGDVPLGSEWPRWFWPGVGATLGVSILILALRLVLHRADNAPLAIAPTPTTESPGNPAPPEPQPAPVVNSSPVASATPTAPIEPQASSVAIDPPVNTVAPVHVDSPADSAIIVNEGHTTPPDALPVDQPPKPTDNPPQPMVADKPSADPQAITAAQPDTQASATVALVVDPTPPLVPPIATAVPPAKATETAPKLANSGPMRFGAPPVRISDDADIGPASTPAVIEPAPSANVVDKPMPRTLRRVPPRVVNVNARLADPIPAFDVHGMPLTDFLSLMSDLSTIPISVDADAIAEMGQSFAAPVQLKLEGASVADVLDAALAGLKLGYHVQDGQLIVGYPPQQNLRDIKFVVADLVGTDEKPLNDLATLVRRMAAPQSWQPSAGAGSMKAAGGVLVSHQTDPVQMEILIFCEKLRIARGLPQKSRFDPARFVLTTRADKARQMLQRPITANFRAPQSLANVFKWLHQTTGATILVDHAALARQEMSVESECTAVAVNQPLAAFLDELLTPIDLAWRVIDDRTLEITTRDGAAGHLDLEFYSARDLAADAEAGQRLIVQIKSKIEPQSWGDKPDQATIQFDAPSRAVIVRAPQKIQLQVEHFLVPSGDKK